MARRIALILAILAVNVGAQDTAAALHVRGAVKKELSLSIADLAHMPRTMLRVGAPGKETAYEGVWLAKILEDAGAPLGGALRGKALTTFVVAGAHDGYHVVFSLAEIDPSFTDNQILIADTADGKPLASDQGPLRLVVPKDKPGARWVRMLETIEVAQFTK